jgi:hypothetical protein
VPVRTEIKDRIGEIVLDHPPVNAFESAGWNELAGIVTTVGATRKCGACDPRRRQGILRRRRHQGDAGASERIVELNEATS